MEVSKASFCVTILLFLFIKTGIVAADISGTAAINVTISAINEIALTGGSVSLTVNSATAGSQPTDATDSATADLSWTTNQAGRKITVITNQASPTFTLTTEATTISGGISAGAITPTISAADFITAIANTVGTCDLTYVGSATTAQGTGSDAHTITYTLTAS
ncbi:MAG: hypothetical protein FVQ80_06170 [Planctomycetes bacterium]|nr:hypothetical protein [Planctomycetota bacterium]